MKGRIRAGAPRKALKHPNGPHLAKEIVMVSVRGKRILFPAALGVLALASALGAISSLRQVLELTGIVLAWTIFIFTLNSRGYLKNRFLFYLGMGYFFSGMLHLVHLFSISSPTLFPYLSQNWNLLFSISARVMENSAFLLAIFFVEKKIRSHRVALLYGIMALSAGLVVYSGFFPPMGVSDLLVFLPLQIVLSFVLIASFIVVLRHKDLFNPVVHEFFLRAIVLYSLSEFLYISQHQSISLAGDLLRIWAWYLVYRAVVQTGFSDPYSMLFSDLKNAQEAERTARKRAERRAEELEVLRANLSDMLSEHESSKLLTAILSRAVSLLNAAGGELGLIDRKRRELLIEAVHNLPESRRGAKVAVGEGVLGLVAQSRAPLVLHGHGVGDGRLPQYPFDQWNGIMAVPLEADGKLVGVISLVEKNPVREFSEADVELLVMFAQQAAMAIRTIQLLERARHQAETDSLTGLFNHRHFFEMAQSEVNRALQEGISLSALMFDIDFFKQVNDTFGHSVGDQVITAIANICRQIFRKADVVGRYGGEEFAVVLPEANVTTAKEVAERIRSAVEDLSFATPAGRFSITISLGIACLNDKCRNLNDLICRADDALYEAKETGRNRICVWRNGLGGNKKRNMQECNLVVRPDSRESNLTVRLQ